MESKQVLEGFAIVIADRSYVYVGDVIADDRYTIISGARNIRRWGTTNGLGELALEGPKCKTVLDAVGTVRIPARAVISIIDTKAELWCGK